MTAISCTNLTRRFDDHVAVDGLTFEVEPGEVFGFLGHNGAGKTTTVRLLNGVLAASEGSARVLGFDPATEGPQLRLRTGVLTETPALDERLSARENLTIFADLYGVPEDEVNRRVDALFERFDLKERAEEKVGGYSKGMKQRLALARSLLHEPEMLFLDEPTGGLDPVAAREVRQLMATLSREEGRTVFLCTHNLIEAQRLCDRVVVLEHGKMLAIGSPRELAQRVGGRQRQEIEVESVEKAVTVLHGIDAVQDIETGENGIISYGGVSREDTPALIAHLAEAGVQIYRVTPLEASLEDIYFALHEE